MANILNRNLFRLTAPVLMVVLLAAQSAEARHREVLSKVGSLVTPVSQQQEVHMGAQLDSTIRDRYPASENYALQEYVSSVGKKIGAVTYKNYPFTYTVLDDKRSANAYAAPGGFIYVTTGLINMLENESQLAAVLAHETAHVTKRHVVKQMQERQAANLAILVLNRMTDRDFNNRLTQVGEFVLFQSFSREDEHDADIVGTELMTRAGYNPRGMVQMLDKLNNMESRGIIIPFLRSHPSSESRARLVEEYIDRNNLEKPNQVMDTRQFHQIVR